MRPDGCCCRSRTSGSLRVKRQHRLDVGLDRALGRSDELHVTRRIGLRRAPRLDAPTGGQITVDEIVRGRLIGHHIGPHAAAHELRQGFGCVAEQSHRYRLALRARIAHERHRVVEVFRLGVEIARLQTHVDARLLAFDRQHRRARHGRRERLRSTHAAQSGGEDPFVCEVPAVMLPPCFAERFVRPLHDSLAADVDPRARCHLAEHHQAFAIELVELLPCRPFRHQIGVRDQHARRIRMRPKHADGLA